MNLKLIMSGAVVVYFIIAAALNAPGDTADSMTFVFVTVLTGVAVSIALVVVKQIAFLFARATMDIHSDFNWTVFVIGSFWLVGFFQKLVT